MKDTPGSDQKEIQLINSTQRGICLKKHGRKLETLHKNYRPIDKQASDSTRDGAMSHPNYYTSPIYGSNREYNRCQTGVKHRRVEFDSGNSKYGSLSSPPFVCRRRWTLNMMGALHDSRKLSLTFGITCDHRLILHFQASSLLSV